MWIESINNFEIKCNTEGLQIDKAGIDTKIQSQKDKTNGFDMITGMTLDSQLTASTSCALVWMKCSWLGMWGKGVWQDTDYDLAQQLNSETVER